MPTKKSATKTKEAKTEIKKEPKKPLKKKIEEKEKTVETEGEFFLADLSKTKQKYFEAVGRRKTSTARVRLYTQGKKDITINGKPCQDYFPISYLQKTVEEPMEKLKCQGKFGFSVKVNGGGLTGQAEAIRHGIARALVLLNPYFKKRLKKTGLLTRDPRMRERKKFGLKRARRAPQWSKR